MSQMVPGLHENTRPQRQKAEHGWADPGDAAFEPRDAPARWVGVGIAGLIGILMLSVAAVLAFGSAVRPRESLHAGTAREHFRTSAPVLEVAPPADRLALEKAHPAPTGAALQAAEDAVVAQGWGDAAPPPSRADVAMHRAEAGR
jgi:hypothetical protein